MFDKDMIYCDTTDIKTVINKSFNMFKYLFWTLFLLFLFTTIIFKKSRLLLLTIIVENKYCWFLIQIKNSINQPL